MEEKDHTEQKGEHHTEHRNGDAHHEHKESIKIKKSNLWMILSCLLAVLLIASIFTGGFRGSVFAGGVLSEGEASDKAITYINTYLLSGGQTAKAKIVEDSGNLYNIKLDIGGREYDSYVTKDGKLLFPSVVELDAEVEKPATQENPPATEIEKTDRPTAELYIFSYCPAGSSTLDSFAEVGKILKDVADVKVKFFSNMHGEYEKQQNIIQECIQKVEGDKYWDYATMFLEEVYKVCGPDRDIECDKTESVELMKEVGIDYNAVLKCVDEEGETLYSNDKEDANELALRYSPSIVINGVYLSNADRSPNGLKTSICSAFNEAPEECSQEIEKSSTASSGSC